MAGFVGIRVYSADRLMYRLFLGLISITLLHEVYIGGGDGTVLRWLLIWPPIFMFLLGKRDGTFLYATFWLALSMIILNPGNLGTYYYGRVGGI